MVLNHLRFYLMFLMMIIIIETLTAQESEMMPEESPVTVDTVDLAKYSGQWYEISKIPNRFQSDCVKNTTATYIMSENGQIQVINRCIDEDNEEIVAKGIARVVETGTNSKLEVSFFSILGIRPFWGDYWIIGLDKDYQYAVVGTADRKYGWILARSVQLTPENGRLIEEILRKQGYDPNDFVATLHD